MIRSPKLKKNQAVFKLFDAGDGQMKLRVTVMAGLRVSGAEDEDEERASHNTPAAVKLEESIIRTRSKIFELAYCNPWDWFFTGTLDAAKYCRTDLETYHKDFTRFIRHFNEYHGLQIKFLVIPELHGDGKSWHMHGFLMGLPEAYLHRFQVGEKMGLGVARKVLAGEAVYNWPAYAKKFGFCDLERIKNKEAVSNYIRKYISKELGKSVQEVGAHLYYRSRGLKEAIPLGSCHAASLPDLGEPTYCGEFTTSWWITPTPEMIDELSSLGAEERGMDFERQHELSMAFFSGER